MVDLLGARLEAIFDRLTVLEQSFGATYGLLCPNGPQLTYQDDRMSPTQARLSEELKSKQTITTYVFKRVPDDYYQQDLDYRRMCLGAESVQHLCKSIIMENTKLSEDNIYATRLHADKLKRALHKQHKADGGALPSKAFNMRLVAEDVSDRLTGFLHNAVTPVGSATPDMPIILSHRILELQPPEAFMWMVGGEKDLKLGMRVDDFVRGYKPKVLDCTYDQEPASNNVDK